MTEETADWFAQWSEAGSIENNSCESGGLKFDITL